MKRNSADRSKRFGRFFAGLFILCTITIGIAPVSHAADNTETALKNVIVSGTVSRTGQYIFKTVTDPVISTIGGDWAILGLARSGIDIPQSYYEKYYNNVLSELTAKKGNLSNVKYTEYSRLIIALTAIGKDVTDVGGFNLLEKLADYNSVVKQGINGPIFALIALDSKDYAIPEVSGVPVKTTRDLLIDYILSKEITDAKGVRGGFALTGNTPDADVTGMALQALAGYKNRPEAKAAIDRALNALSGIRLKDGGYKSGGTENLESVAQVIVAKTALGVDASSEVSAMLKYCASDGSIRHILAGDANQMAVEQGFYGLVAYDRYINDKNALYDMSDTAAPSNQAIRVFVPIRTILKSVILSTCFPVL